MDADLTRNATRPSAAADARTMARNAGAAICTRRLADS
jgi:hypothetical protein